jgi:hypothetical protein
MTSEFSNALCTTSSDFSGTRYWKWRRRSSSDCRPRTNIYGFNKDGLVNGPDVTDAQSHGTIAKTWLNLTNKGTRGPIAPEIVPPASGNAVVSSALVSSSQSPATPTIPPWLASRLAHLALNRIDLNSGQLANFFEHLAHENTAKSRAIVVEAEQVADAVGLDDEVIDGPLIDLGLE